MPIAEMPQSNKQHAVPQNIMDVDFKLVGDLTMRQFAYLLLFGVLSYLSYVLVIGLFKLPVVVTLALTGLGLAFMPVEERGLDEWIVNFFKSLYLPTQRVWRKEPTIPSAFLQDSLSVVKQELITLAPTSSRRKLEEYLKYQTDSKKVDPLDIPEEKYIMQVKEAYADLPYADVQGAPSSVIVDTLVSDDITDVSDLSHPDSQLPQIPDKSFENGNREEGENEDKDKDKDTDKDKSIETENNKDNITQVNTNTLDQINKDNNYSKDNKDIGQKTVQNVVPTPKESVVPTPSPKKRLTPKYPKKPQSSVSVIPITPDMHSGRKFTNFLPSQGELVLPIRGERVLQTSDQSVNEEDIKEKAQQLEQLLSNIRSKENIKPSSINSNVNNNNQKDIKVNQPINLTQSVENKDDPVKLAKDLKSQTGDLNDEIEKLRKQIQDSKNDSKSTFDQENKLKLLEDEKEKAKSEYSKLAQQIGELQDRLNEVSQANQSDITFQQKPTVPSYSNIKSFVSKTNVIAGMVKDKDGNLLDNILLIVKNDRMEPIRAFKTNAVGQFELSSPLENGVYTIEVSPLNDTGLTFDIISVQLRGEVLPLLEIKGR